MEKRNQMANHRVTMKFTNAYNLKAEPVNHGHWRYSLGIHDLVCSVCDGRAKSGYREMLYCPYCGARMNERSPIDELIKMWEKEVDE